MVRNIFDSLVGPRFLGRVTCSMQRQTKLRGVSGGLDGVCVCVCVCVGGGGNRGLSKV